MSEFWQRKIATYFRFLDVDKNGVLTKNDFDLIAQRFCASGKVVPVKHEELRKHSVDAWLLYMGSTKTDEKGFLTEAVMIDSIKKQKNDPKLKATLEVFARDFFDALDTNEDGYIQREEFRRLYDNIGIPDSCFAEQAFNAIDTNHDGKLSFDEVTHAFLEFLLSEDEDSPYSLLFGPLI